MRLFKLRPKAETVPQTDPPLEDVDSEEEKLPAEEARLIELHFNFAQRIRANYRQRDRNPDAMVKAISHCEKQIAIAPRVADAMHMAYGHDAPLPSHTGYDQLSTILESMGLFDDALLLSEEAMAQGWGGDWDRRIDRLRRKAARK